MRRWRSRIQLSFKLISIILLAVFLSSPTPSLRAEGGRSFDLSEARILQQVLIRVVDSYVDPNRIRPKMMMVKGLDWIQQSVAEVQVRYELPPATWDPPSCQQATDCDEAAWPLSQPGGFECFEGQCLPLPDELTVQVDTESRNFSLGDVRGPQTLEQVGEHFGVTKERIRQIEGRALNKLRRMLSPQAVEEVLS